MTVDPSSGMRRSVVLGRTRRLALVCALATAAVACTNSPGSIVGIWRYDSYTADGKRVQVDVGVNAADRPYIVFDEMIHGMAGCNGFGQVEEERYHYAEGRLDPGEIVFEAAGCVPESLMDSERAIQTAVWSNDVIDVTIEGEAMSWHAGAQMLTFSRVEDVPTTPPPPQQTSFGALDCAPDPVARTMVPAEGTDAEAVAFEADPSVVVVVVEDSRKLHAEGYDADGEVVLVVAFDDVPPETFSVYSCP